MDKKISVLVLFAVLFCVAFVPAPAQQRYTSPVIWIDTGECVTFLHGLPARPQFVTGWERLGELDAADFTYQQLGTDELRVYVSIKEIHVCSNSSMYFYIVAQE